MNDNYLILLKELYICLHHNFITAVCEDSFYVRSSMHSRHS